MTSRETTSRHDLDWLAFCYVTGELSAAEATAFEERLAADDGACEAVARAMELNLAVAAVMDDADAVRSSGGSPEFETISGTGEPPVLRALPSRWTSAALTLIAASAIAVAMFVAVGSSVLTGNKIAKRDGTDRLVAAWAQGEAVRNEADDDNDGLDADDDDLDPPDWMLAAVTAEEQAELLPGDDAREVREN
jgi:anti-sigma-K factor RskA